MTESAENNLPATVNSPKSGYLNVAEVSMIAMDLFVIKAEAPVVTLKSIYAGVTPFILADLLRLALLKTFPAFVISRPIQCLEGWQIGRGSSHVK